MSGAVTPRAANRSRIRGTAAAASSRSTVRRTISEPARASAAIWRAVASTSAVSVLVIDWTTTGAPPPTVTAASPAPTRTPALARRGAGPKGGSVLVIGFSYSNAVRRAEGSILGCGGGFVIEYLQGICQGPSKAFSQCNKTIL